MERSLWTMALKGYANTILGIEFHQGTMLITFSDQDLETIKMPHADPLSFGLGMLWFPEFWLTEEAIKISSSRKLFRGWGYIKR